MRNKGAQSSSFYDYELITNGVGQGGIRTADEILQHGWTRRGAPRIDIWSPIPWEFPGQELRSWNFYIHSLDMIEALLSAYSLTHDGKYLGPALRIGLDWAEKHPRGSEECSPMAWYDMAVGLRAYRLGYLFQASDQAQILDEPARSVLWSSLMDHCAELMDDAKIAFHSNHGYYQVAGQLALGRRFADVSGPMAALYAEGTKRLKRMLHQQFGPDGVHREHSPDYHRMVAETLLGLVRSSLVCHA